MSELPTHPLFRDLTGLTFSRLRVLGYAGRIGTSHAFECRCECGNTTVTRGYLLTGGVTRSCGCLLGDRNREVRGTHRLSWSREWRIWSGMKTRCGNPKVKSFPDYGGRGIKVCERWLTGDGYRSGFECFIADMGMRPTPKHSLERKNNEGHYEPGNVVWATRAEQAKNTRATRRIVFGGAERTSHQWSEVTGIPATEINKRLGRGWSPERALTQPLREARHG